MSVHVETVVLLCGNLDYTGVCENIRKKWISFSHIRGTEIMPDTSKMSFLDKRYTLLQNYNHTFLQTLKTAFIIDGLS